ncbi:MAG TPA: hypothetical protein PLN21_12060 [Gemmatales bacterium]|nr:hypothetical protein [Gemmatales bacterium]
MGFYLKELVESRDGKFFQKLCRDMAQAERNSGRLNLLTQHHEFSQPGAGKALDASEVEHQFLTSMLLHIGTKIHSNEVNQWIIKTHPGFDFNDDHLAEYLNIQVCIIRIWHEEEPFLKAVETLMLDRRAVYCSWQGQPVLRVLTPRLEEPGAK